MLSLFLLVAKVSWIPVGMTRKSVVGCLECALKRGESKQEKKKELLLFEEVEMVRFRVQKGSTFAFECSSDEAQSDDLRRLFTRAEDLEALQCVLAVQVALRMCVTEHDTWRDLDVVSCVALLL